MTITDLLIDDDNWEKITAHGIQIGQLIQILAGQHVIVRNRRAAYLLIGLDDGGACIAAPFERTAEPGVVRPVTAWYCKPSEWARLR